MKAAFMSVAIIANLLVVACGDTTTPVGQGDTSSLMGTSDTSGDADHVTADDTSASDDTTLAGDSVSSPEDTETTCQFQAGDPCPGLGGCILTPRDDGRWDCTGGYTIGPDSVCSACFY
jgi:hypothetical protein